MVIYPIAMIAATLASSSTGLPETSAHAASLFAMQASAYSGVPRDGNDGPVPKNAEWWILMSDYPAEALAARREGKAVFRLQVTKKGAVDSCRIVESSGHEDLDRLTCMRISERAIFEPARTAKGRAVAGVYQNAVRWRLP